MSSHPLPFKTKKMLVYIPQDDFKNLKIIAAKMEKSMSEIMRDLIRAYINHPSVK